MIRFLLIIALLFLIYRIMKRIVASHSSSGNTSGSRQEASPPKPYQSIQDATFEDITEPQDTKAKKP